MRRATWVLGVVVLAAAAACQFEPDLSRFAPCTQNGACPPGTSCLPEVGRCLPHCGEPGGCGLEEVPAEHPGAGDGGQPADAGAGGDAGTPGGGSDGGLSPDAGAGGDAGVPLTPDAGTPPPVLRVAGPSRLADAYATKAYADEVAALGGTPPYHFTLEPGSTLPSGLQLSAGGALTGTSSDSGDTSFTLRVTDSGTPAQTATRELWLRVNALPLTLLLTLTTQALPNARVGQPYRYTLRAVGNTGATTWMLSAGSLPIGVLLDTDTGVLSGTPTQAGAHSVTLTVSDTLTSQSSGLTLSVE